MTDETKQLIQLQLEVLQQTMKDNGVILALKIDKEDTDNSKVLFIDKKLYLTEGRASGISVSLTDFNKELL